MRFVIAHELGHALSGHAVYRTLLLWLGDLTGVWNSIPGGAIGASDDRRRAVRVAAQVRAVGGPCGACWPPRTLRSRSACT